MNAIKYRPEIDGLRAIAILPVLVFHFCESWLKGGFLGVDVFFVISGYLITSIIINELNLGNFRFKNFWERRARRIFPALAFLLIFLLLFSFCFYIPSETLSSLGRQSLKVLALTSNQYLLAITGDYWGQSADVTTLLHTWSLSLEEQFYLFLPVAFFLFYKFKIKKALNYFVIGIFLISLFWCIVETKSNSSKAFFLLHTRAWELLAGSILALNFSHFEKKEHFLSKWLANFGLILIVVSYFILTNNQFPGWKAIVPVAGAFLYIGFSVNGGYAATLLSTRPFVYVGKISYSLYLWHWPALVLGKMFADLFEKPEIRTYFFIASIILSLISYYWVEKFGKTIKNIWKPSGWACLIIIGLSLPAVYNARDNASQNYLTTEYKGLLYENFTDNISSRLASKYRNMGIKVILPEKEGLDAIGDFHSVIVNRELKPEVIILGDSHGLMWGSLIERIIKDNNVGGVFWTASATAPLIENEAILGTTIDSIKRTKFNEDRLNSIKVCKPKVVVIAMRLDTKWDINSKEQRLFKIEHLLRVVHELSPYSKVVLIGQPPLAAFGDQNAVQWLGWRSKFYIQEEASILDSPNWGLADDYISSLAKKFSFVHFISVSDIYKSGENKIKLVKNNQIVYTDDDHLSEFGASLSEYRIRTAVERLLKDI